MGNARWSSDSYRSYTDSIKTKSTDQVFNRRTLDDDLNPAKIKVRESVDSEANPNSTPVIVFCDNTGSMGYLADLIIREGLGKIAEGIVQHKPITDPHIAVGCVGDAFSDKFPLQVTQFEADPLALVKQVERLFLEKNGGSNKGESYSLPWLFSTYKVTSSAWQKRKQKGFLFTIGDESPHPKITRAQVESVMGVGAEGDVDSKSLLDFALDFWEVFHLVVNPVPYQPVVQNWWNLLGKERTILVEDHTKLPEVITAIIRLKNGQKDVTQGQDKSTALVVQRATNHLVQA